MSVSMHKTQNAPDSGAVSPARMDSCPREGQHRRRPGAAGATGATGDRHPGATGGAALTTLPAALLSALLPALLGAALLAGAGAAQAQATPECLFGGVDGVPGVPPSQRVSQFRETDPGVIDVPEGEDSCTIDISSVFTDYDGFFHEFATGGSHHIEARSPAMHPSWVTFTSTSAVLTVTLPANAGYGDITPAPSPASLNMCGITASSSTVVNGCLTFHFEVRRLPLTEPSAVIPLPEQCALTDMSGNTQSTHQATESSPAFFEFAVTQQQTCKIDVRSFFTDSQGDLRAGTRLEAPSPSTIPGWVKFGSASTVLTITPPVGPGPANQFFGTRLKEYTGGATPPAVNLCDGTSCQAMHFRVRGVLPDVDNTCRAQERDGSPVTNQRQFNSASDPAYLATQLGTTCSIDPNVYYERQGVDAPSFADNSKLPFWAAIESSILYLTPQMLGDHAVHDFLYRIRSTSAQGRTHFRARGSEPPMAVVQECTLTNMDGSAASAHRATAASPAYFDLDLSAGSYCAIDVADFFEDSTGAKFSSFGSGHHLESANPAAHPNWVSFGSTGTTLLITPPASTTDGVITTSPDPASVNFCGLAGHSGGTCATMHFRVRADNAPAPPPTPTCGATDEDGRAVTGVTHAATMTEPVFLDVRQGQKCTIDIRDFLTSTAHPNYNDLFWSSQTGVNQRPSWIDFPGAFRAVNSTIMNITPPGSLGLGVVNPSSTYVAVTALKNFAGTTLNQSAETWNFRVRILAPATPTGALQIPNQTATEGQLFALQTAPFFAPVSDRTLLYGLVGAPDWLQDGGSGLFYGTPDGDAEGTFTLVAIASEQGGQERDFSITFTLTVANVNRAPRAAIGIASQRAVEDSPFLLTLADGTFVDDDGGDLTLTATQSSGADLPMWLNFTTVAKPAATAPATDADIPANSFFGTPAQSDVELLNITLTATDTGQDGVAGTPDSPGDDESASIAFAINVVGVNEPPEIGMLPDWLAVEGEDNPYIIAEDVFTDPDGDTLTYSAAGNPPWFVFNPNTRTFSGIPGEEDVTSTPITITVTATDGDNYKASDSFDLTVHNANDAPQPVEPLEDQSATEDVLFIYTFPETSFVDPDIRHGDVLTYTVSGAPSWLIFDSDSRSFVGTPLNEDVTDPPSGSGPITITVTARDKGHDTVANTGDEETATDSFELSVANANDAPRIAAQIISHRHREDRLYSLDFVRDFEDDDIRHGDSLTFSYVGPTWLALTGTGTALRLQGTPTNAHLGDHDIILTATDEQGESVSMTFVITVINTNDPPQRGEPLQDQVAVEDEDISYTFPLSSFTDADGDPLTYTASGNPKWFVFLPADRTFIGTPRNGDVTTSAAVTITVFASDGIVGSQPATSTFELIVENTNDAPRVNGTVPDQVAVEDTLFTYTFPEDLFIDDDVGHFTEDRDTGVVTAGVADTLYYSALEQGEVVLPDWLAFEPATRTFTGTPRRQDYGDTLIVITARDRNAGEEDVGSVSTTMRITVGVNAAKDRAARERNIRFGMGSMMRTLAWDTVDSIGGRTRNRCVEGSEALDMSGLSGLANANAVAGIDRSAGWAEVEALGVEMDAERGLLHAGASTPGTSGMNNGSAGAGNGWAGGGVRGGLNDGLNQSLVDDFARSIDDATQPSTPRAADLCLWASAQRGDARHTLAAGHRFEWDSATYRAGVEGTYRNGVLGFAISHYEGDLNFTEAPRNVNGLIDMTQWSINPYMSSSNGASRLWGTAGMGFGEMTYHEVFTPGGDYENIAVNGGSQTWSLMLAAGAEYDLLAREVVQVVGRVEGMGLRLGINEDDKGDDLYGELDVDAHGLRGELELALTLGGGGNLVRPYTTAAYRWDGGDAGNEYAVEFGLGVQVRTGDLNLEAVAHSQPLSKDDDLKRRSYSVSLGYDRGNDRQGLTLQVRNSYSLGLVGGQFDPFSGEYPVSPYADADSQHISPYPGVRQKASEFRSIESGFGIPHRLGTLTPYALSSFSGGTANRYGWGLRFVGGNSNIDLRHVLRPQEEEDEHTLELRAKFNF